MLTIINQCFEITNKLKENPNRGIERSVQRIFYEIEEKGYTIINPIHRTYKETDTDIEASLTKSPTSKSKITKVLKPIIYYKENDTNTLVQKGIVLID